MKGEGLQVVTYAVKANADITAHDPEFSLAGMRFRLQSPESEIDFPSPLVGPPHIYNTLAAVARGHSLGYALDVITKAWENAEVRPDDLNA